MFDPFSKAKMAPPDPIYGVTERFATDPHPEKINLAIGVYQNEHGVTPVLRSVNEASRLVIETERTKAYLPSAGATPFLIALDELSLGLKWELDQDLGRIRVQTVGGTGALSMAFRLLSDAGVSRGCTVWSGSPTWDNHPPLVLAGGLRWATLPYYFSCRGTPGAGRIEFDQFYESLKLLAPADILLLQTGCHNPTGADLTLEQWELVRQRIRALDIVPVLDCAYQGFGRGIEADGAPVRMFLDDRGVVLIAYSCSKNFGLYRERVGALIVQTGDPGSLEVATSRVKHIIRSSYATPPSFGAHVVSTIINTAELRALWNLELAEMRARLNSVRGQFVSRISEQTGIDFSAVGMLSGMFMLTGLSTAQVATLRDAGIYLVENGRLCFSGLNDNNLDIVSSAIGKVLVTCS